MSAAAAQVEACDEGMLSLLPFPTLGDMRASASALEGRSLPTAFLIELMTSVSPSRMRRASIVTKSRPRSPPFQTR